MAYNDGSAYASAGSPQYASLLDQYGANRAPFEVAGVDYRVGTPEGLALRSPTTISMAGVTVNSSSHTITITGNNVTLDGYDFRGWAVVTTAANTSLINSTFNGVNPGGAQSSVISGTSSSSNLLVSHCSIDGMSGAGGRAEFLVEMEGPGLTVEYSWLRNSNSDIIGRHGASGGDITIQNNLIEQAGMGGSGTHGDYLQVYGPTVDSTHILFNTTIQNGGTTQGFIADNTRSGEFAGNTMIGSVSYFMSASGPGTNAANFSGVFNTHDNYFDASRAFGFNYPDAGPNDGYGMTQFTHNVNMVSGRVEQDSNAPATSWPAQGSTPTAPTPGGMNGTPAGDVLLGDANTNTIYAGAGNDQIAGNDGNDTVFGEAGSDIISGGNGNDGLLGGEGFDFIAGGAGDDAIMGQNGNDTLWGDDNSAVAGNDAIDGGDGNDTIFAGSGNDTVVGGAGNDAIAGGDGVDMLYGHAGADIIFGGNGADLITGGAGADILRGEGGGDLFVFNFGDNGDLIQGFNQGGVRDGLDLRGYFNATGYTGTNPIADGIMNVVQHGADADVYLNGAFAFRIEGVTAAAIDNSYVISQ